MRYPRLDDSRLFARDLTPRPAKDFYMIATDVGRDGENGI
jgi:hypothetical protein